MAHHRLSAVTRVEAAPSAFVPLYGNTARPAFARILGYAGIQENLQFISAGTPINVGFYLHFFHITSSQQ
jgi:hypothetical protein